MPPGPAHPPRHGIWACFLDRGGAIRVLPVLEMVTMIRDAPPQLTRGRTRGPVESFPPSEVGSVLMVPAEEIASTLADALAGLSAHPLALLGRTGSGKTRLLRSVAGPGRHEVVCGSARDLVEQMTEAIRNDRYPRYRERFTGDERPLCIEHLEDLRGKAATRTEVRRLLAERTARGRSTVLTMTRARGDAEVVEWLASWADLLVLD